MLLFFNKSFFTKHVFFYLQNIVFSVEANYYLKFKFGKKKLFFFTNAIGFSAGFDVILVCYFLFKETSLLVLFFNFFC